MVAKEVVLLAVPKADFAAVREKVKDMIEFDAESQQSIAEPLALFQQLCCEARRDSNRRFLVPKSIYYRARKYCGLPFE